MFKIILAFTLGGLTLGISGCHHGCTMMDCSDQVAGTITTPTGTWPAGSYVITIATEDGSHTCSMNLPADLPGTNSDTYLPCDPELDYFRAPILTQIVECTEVSPTTVSCAPVPGQYEVRWGIEGTPGTVAIRVERDGVVLADEDFSPDYEESRPNGKGCGPVCHTATADVVLP